MLEVIVIAVVIAAGFVAVRQTIRRKNRRPEAVVKPSARVPYHCVEVSAGTPACKAALETGNVRYLSGEAPPIPVPGCDQPQCRCRYVHHADRRDEDRRNPYGQWTNLPTGLVRERRRRVERRRPQDVPFKRSMRD